MGFFSLILLSVTAQAVLGQTFGKRGADTICANVHPLMTTPNGAPVDSKTASMTAGPRGPVLMQDFLLIDELSRFNREKIPERPGHAKGAGAFGYFTVTDTSITKYCRASLFSKVGKRTEVAVRFSTSGRESGSCDTVRDTRGGAFKFYTDDGNYDLVGNNMQTFWIRDSMMLGSLIRSNRRDPSSHLFDPTMFWDFLTLRPETMHHLIYIFSDLGTPDGYRFSSYHGSHTFKVVNKDNKPFYIKFHLLPDQGIRNLTGPVAAAMCGTDLDYATRDLYTSIEQKQFPSWTMKYQIMTFEQAAQLKYNPFDLTKIWYPKDFPFYEIGKVVLNRNPLNYFVEVEEIAFSPSNLVPGIEPSPDKVLLARLFAYTDAQRYRLGVNFPQLPVNAARVPISNTNRDGFMSFFNQGNYPTYYPNSIKGSPQICPAAAESKWSVTGDVARYETGDEDNYSQASTLYKEEYDDLQRSALIGNVVGHLKLVKRVEIQKLAIANFKNVDADLAKSVATGLGLTV